MKWQLVSANHLWQRPTDVLFFPWNPESHLQREIDWYLNFDLSKAFQHQMQSLTTNQTNLVSDVGLSYEVPEKKSEHVLCLAPEHFFAKYVVATLPNPKKTLSDSFNEVMDWLKASRGSVILPPSSFPDQFEAALQKLGFDKEVVVAVDVNAPLE